MNRSTPPWIDVRLGTAPVVLFAPHGGRRLAVRQPGRHKVNDLHTATLTAALAIRCGASAIINPTRDRNELDLNRIRQVRAHAPWLPALLADLLEHIVDRQGHATLLVIHGWNIGQPACDIGIGMVERAGRLELARPGSQTVSRGFLDGVLPRLRAAARERGIAVTIGARYPAAHPNNLLQLCSAPGDTDAGPDERRLSALAASGRLDAAQLELGLPLRWPGPGREHLLRVVAGALLGTPEEPAPAAPTPTTLPTRLACGGTVTERRTLQFVDGPLLGLTGMEVGARGSIGGRLLLSAANDTLELFTGELGDRTGPRWHVPPLRYIDTADGWQLRFRGRLLSFPTLEPFLDLERGLAVGHLATAEVALAFRPCERVGGSPALPAFGRVAGVVVLGARRFAVDTIGVHGDGTTPATRSLPCLRLLLPSTPYGHVAVGSHGARAERGTLTFALAGHALTSDGSRAVTGAAALTLDARTGRLAATLDRDRIHGVVERLIPIRRPGKPGRVLHTTYGVVRTPGRASGWLELTTEHVIGPPAATPHPEA